MLERGARYGWIEIACLACGACRVCYRWPVTREQWAPGTGRCARGECCVLGYHQRRYDNVSLTANADATSLALSIGYPTPVPGGCPSGTGSSAAVGSGGDFIGGIIAATATQRNLVVGGYVEESAATAIAGIFTADPVEGGSCPARRLAWVATSPGAVNPAGPRANTVYSGTVTAPGATTSSGTAQAATNADGTVRSVIITQTIGACTYQVGTPTSQASVTLTRGSFSIPLSGGAYIVGVAGPTRIAGGFVAPAQGNCPSVTGVWRANVPASATPTSTPGVQTTATPAPAGRFISGSIPATGIGLVVFGGGTNAQLVAGASCPAGAGAFWVTNSAGEFVTYVPGAAVAVVNEAWLTLFVTGIPANTPMLGRC